MKKTKLKFKVWDRREKRYLEGYEEASEKFLGIANSPEDKTIFSISFGEPDDYFLIERIYE